MSNEIEELRAKRNEELAKIREERRVEVEELRAKRNEEFAKIREGRQADLVQLAKRGSYVALGLGLFSGVPDPVLFEDGGIRTSQVPWKPVERVPRSGTPVEGLRTLLAYRPRLSPSASHNASAAPHNQTQFQGSITRPSVW